MVLHMSALDFQNENFQAISTYVVLMLTTNDDGVTLTEAVLREVFEDSGD
jgi:hypothetical protein